MTKIWCIMQSNVESYVISDENIILKLWTAVHSIVEKYWKSMCRMDFARMIINKFEYLRLTEFFLLRISSTSLSETYNSCFIILYEYEYFKIEWRDYIVDLKFVSRLKQFLYIIRRLGNYIIFDCINKLAVFKERINETIELLGTTMFF